MRIDKSGAQTTLIAGLGAAFAFFAPVAYPSLGQLVAPLAPVPLMFCALRYGLRHASLATAWACVALVLMSMIGMKQGLDGLQVLIGFLLAVGLPGLLACRLYLTAVIHPSGRLVWYPLERIALLFVVWGWLVLGLMAVYITTTTGQSLEAWLTGELTPVAQMMVNSVRDMTGNSAVTPAVLAAAMARQLPAAGVLVFSLSMLLNLLISHYIGLRRGGVLRPWPDITTFAVSPAVGTVFAVAVILALVPGGGVPSLVVNVLIAGLAFPIGLQGLSVLHAFLRKKVAKSVATGIYGVLLVAMLLLALYVSFVLVVVGLADQVFDFRRRRPRG